MKLTYILLLFLISCASFSGSENEFGSTDQTDKEKQTERADLHYSIGKSLEKHGRLISATESYQTSIKEDPTYSKSYFALGKILVKRKYNGIGISQIKKALEVDAENTEARNYLAYIYYNQGKLLDSLELIKKSTQDLTYWNQEETWALKLKLDIRLKRFNETKFSALQALRATPQKCITRVSVAKSFLKINDYQKALKAARQAENLCEAAGRSDKLAYLKSIIFIKRGNLAVAEDLLSKIKVTDESLRNKIPQLLMSLRKKINSGM